MNYTEIYDDYKIGFIVEPRFVNDITGEESPFYDEVGTDEFYIIVETLIKHLGPNIYCCISKENPDYFTIYKIEKSQKNIEIIKNIYELNTDEPVPIWPERCPSTHIKFNIISS